MKLMEHWGNGIPRIIKMVKAAGLREPEFIDGDVDLRINIYRAQNRVIGSNNEPNLEMNLINLLLEKPKMTQKKLALALNISESSVKRLLAKLQAERKIGREGNRRSGKWIVL